MSSGDDQITSHVSLGDKLAKPLKRFGANPPYAGPRGKAPRLTGFTPPSRPPSDHSYVVRPKPRAFRPVPSTQPNSTWHNFNDDEGGPDSPRVDSDQPNRRQQERQRQDLRWQEELPQLMFHRCWLASEATRWQQVRDSLHAEFSSRLSTAATQCFHCDASQALQPTPSAVAITLVFSRAISKCRYQSTSALLATKQ